jgi:nucleoside-diphosphate-sugar epimerase
LVTGAAGRIGRVVVADLVERGHEVRAVTSRALVEPTSSRPVDWRTFDFLEPADYGELVRGCDAVMHLAAEIGKADRMPGVNVEATRRLAEAAEREGVSAFCYVSTVSIYGSGLARNMAEDAPTLTVDRDVPSEYWALDYVRTYGRTKLAGEQALHEVADKVSYVVLRPTVVVDIAEMIAVRDWSRVKRELAAHRHAHHIYVRDVSDAMIWAVERALAGEPAPGRIETFNLADDDCPEPRHADFMRKAFAASGDPRYRTLNLPGFADWLHDFLRFRTLPFRNPLWRMRFPNDRLRAAGYSFRFGMANAQAMALNALEAERAGAKRASAH